MKKYQRIVVKVGTSSLTDENGKIALEKFNSLIDDLANVKKQGYEVILVSSGAVGCGNGILNITENTGIAQKQASAAVGQVQLMNTYANGFEKFGINVGQILLTRTDLYYRKRNINFMNTLNELLKIDALPIINENDSITVEEIKIGDNDNLSALVSIISNASLLILLSDIDGVYDDNPSKNPDAKFISVIDKIDEEIYSYAQDKGSKFSTGGMFTKLQAGEKVTNAGIDMIIANSSVDGIVSKVLNEEGYGTLFKAQENRINEDTRWLLIATDTKGEVIVDEIHEDKPIDLSSIIEVKGDFEIGDFIKVRSKDLNSSGRGVSNYSSKDLQEMLSLSKKEFDKKIMHDYLYPSLLGLDKFVVKKEQ